MKLTGKLNWIRVAAGLGVVAGGAGIGMAIYATHKISGDNGIDDLKKQLDKKSDLKDDIIEMDDKLEIIEYGPMKAVKYQNEETGQFVGMQPVDVDATNSKLVNYKLKINVLARLEKRGERFVGTMHQHDVIRYIFKDKDNHIIQIVEINAGNGVAQHSGKYEFATDSSNQYISITVSNGASMKVGKTMAELKPVHYYQQRKEFLFPEGSVPSVNVEFIKDAGLVFTPKTTPSSGTRVVPVEKQVAEMIRIKYYTHVGYAFSRGILAGKAVYEYLNTRLEVLEGTSH